jgi:hypothetical protein
MVRSVVCRVKSKRLLPVKPIGTKAMRLPHARFTVRTLLLLPIAVSLLAVAIDRLTAPPVYWMMGPYELDVVDAYDRHPIKARVTVTYEGPLAGQRPSGGAWITDGEPYKGYRWMTPERSYAGMVGIVGHRPKSLFLQRRDRSFIDGARFRVEAKGYESFTFTPVDAAGRPMEFDAWDPPVFRVELRPAGAAGVSASWSTRPELK